MDVDLDLLNPKDPARRFAAMAWLRENDPVHPVGSVDGPTYLARYAAVAEALPQVNVFSGGVGAADVSRDLQALNGVAEPRHGRIRRIVNGLIAPHRSGEVRPFLEGICSDRLDQIDSAAPGSVEMMSAFVDYVP